MTMLEITYFIHGIGFEGVNLFFPPPTLRLLNIILMGNSSYAVKQVEVH